MEKFYKAIFGEPFLGRRIRYPIIRKKVDSGGRLLDVGCGDGFYVSKFSDRFDQAFGIDINVRDRFPTLKENKVDSSVINADAKKIPFKDNTFDTVICSEVIEHDSNPKKIIREIARLLKKDGTLILTTPEKNCIKLLDHVVPGYSMEELEELLAKENLTIVDRVYYLKRIGYFLWKTCELHMKSKYLKALFFPILYSISKLDNIIGGEGKGIIIKAKKL